MKKKEAILVGVAAGIPFGVMQSFSVGPAGGLFMGLFFGIGMSVLLCWFANSKAVSRQTSLDEDILLPGEQVLCSKPANLIVRPKDFGLQKFAFDDLMWTVGMHNKESLGGAVHLTNYRILFKSHRFNRLRGMTSIFLPTIQQLENRSVLVFRKLAVFTNTAKVEFVVGDVDNVISQITAARDQMNDATFSTLKTHVANHSDKCSDALEPWNALNKFNNLFNLGRKTTGAVQAVSSPLAAIGSIFIDEPLERAVANKPQPVHHPAAQQMSNQPLKRPAA